VIGAFGGSSLAVDRFSAGFQVIGAWCLVIGGWWFSGGLQFLGRFSGAWCLVIGD